LSERTTVSVIERPRHSPTYRADLACTDGPTFRT
jgi:hypothetical protein